MERIKDVWYAVIRADRIVSVHPTKELAEDIEGVGFEGEKVERVRIEITRIKTS